MIFSSQEEWQMQYPIAVLDKAELQHFLSVAEVDRLTEQDVADIAQVMQQELDELGFWELLAVVARTKVTEKQGVPINGA
jgi:hypothetical protein